MTRLAIRLRRIYAELDYAQRRSLELRTGRSFTGPPRPSRRTRRQIAELDRAWDAN
jgi:hypothetical protein